MEENLNGAKKNQDISLYGMDNDVETKNLIPKSDNNTTFATKNQTDSQNEYKPKSIFVIRKIEEEDSAENFFLDNESVKVKIKKFQEHPNNLTNCQLGVLLFTICNLMMVQFYI